MKTSLRACLVLLPLGVLAGAALSQEGNLEVVRAVPISERSMEWPRAFTVDDAEVVLYEPRVEKWDGRKVVARFAAGVQFRGATDPVYGSFTVQADMIANEESRTASLFNFSAGDFRLDDSPERLADFRRSIEALAPDKPLKAPLDDLLALVREGGATAGEGLATATRTTAPAIFVRSHPALLLAFDRKPLFRRVADSGLEAAVNTPATLLRPEGAGGPLFLLTNEGMWLRAESLEGPWQGSLTAPPGITRIPEDHPVGQALAALAGRGAVLTAVPEVVVSTSPAELIVFDGKPVYDRVAGLPLARAANCDTPVFFHFDTAAFYTVISGRWFSAPDLPGPWVYVAHDRLPAEFAQIPTNDPAADVRASIAGTREAQQAVLEAQIPRVARVNVSEAPSISVDYDGGPVFEDVPDTGLAYAVNTIYDVIRCDGRYYCCHDGLWFSADVAFGSPWRICLSVPRRIYLLPPSCPLYHVRFCEVADYGDGWCEYRCTPGYWGTYVDPYTNVCVFGTGYLYPSYTSPTCYFGYPWTYGYGCRYERYRGFVQSPRWIAHSGVVHHFRRGHNEPIHADLVRYGGRFDARGWQSSGGRSRPFTAWKSGVKSLADVVVDHIAARKAVPVKPSAAKPRVVAHQIASSPSFDRNVHAGQAGELYRRSGTGWQRRDSGHWKETDKSHPVDPKIVTLEKHRSSQNTVVTPKGDTRGTQPFVMPKGKVPPDAAKLRDDLPKTKSVVPTHPKIEIRNEPPKQHTLPRTHVEDAPPKIERHIEAPQPRHIETPAPKKLERHDPVPQPKHVETPQPRHIETPAPKIEHRDAPKHDAPSRHSDDKKDDKKNRQ